MEPDGILQDEKRKRGVAGQQPGGRRSRQRTREMVNTIRVGLGLRRLPDAVGQEFLGAAASRSLPDDDDPESVRRALQFMLAGLVFAAVVFGAVWAFGRMADSPEADFKRTAATRELVLNALDRLAAGDVVGAQKLRDEAVQSSQRSLQVALLDGYLLSGRGAEGDAEAARLASAGGSGTEGAAALVTLSGFRMARNDPAGAIRALSDALKASPNNPELLLFQATAYLAAGKPQDAIEAASALERSVGPNASSFDIRGRSYLAMGQAEKARYEFEGGLQYAPEMLHLRLGLSDALTQLGQLDRAEDQARQVLRYYPDSADAYLCLGVIAERRNDPKGAEEAYRRSVEINPRQAKSLNNLAYLLADRMGRPSDALPFAKRAAAIVPGAPEVQDTLGWTYHKLGRSAEAVPLLEQAAQKLPGSAEVQAHLQAARKGGGG